MQVKMFLSLFAAAIIFSTAALGNNSKTSELARMAVFGDDATSKTAISELRAMGPKGLEALILQYNRQVKEFSASGVANEEWRRIATVIDSVAMQKDAYSSGIYWYTDLDEAVKIAKAKDRPILSLRLLGDLNEEFSCANSRLFRAILYSDPDISKYLRDNYVLHWRSVRPAPKITIDFGDGRKIERTVTGNSIHYILDEDGRIIDGLPGLYSPKAFKIYLEQGKRVNDAIDGHAPETKSLALRRYRSISFDRIRERRENAVKVGKVELTEPETGTEAIRAAPIATAKMMATDEISLLRRYDDFARFEPALDLSNWKKLAEIYSPNPILSQESIRFIERQNRNTGRTKAEVDSMLAKLREYVALDTTRNDFLYHPKIYEWLNSRNGAAVDVELFNDRVYAEIFQTPNSDRWLGLYSSDVYTALDGNGIIQ